MFRGISPAMRTAVTSALALAGAFACSSDCGDAGCVPALFADGSIETASRQLIVTACLNQRCASVELDLGAAACAALTLSSDSRICFTQAAPGRLSAALELHSIGGELAFANGDVLALEVTEKGTT